MKIIKKILHCLGFIIGGSILTWLTLGISTLVPIYAFTKILDLGTFMFILIGSIIMAIYYAFNSVIIGVSFLAVYKMKPDYWVSNFILVIVSIFFYYTLFNALGKSFNWDFSPFTSFKGILFITTVIPAYWGLLYKSLLVPFLPYEEAKVALIL